ncbi:non-histone protein [Coemansia sp. IMI 203386]|nr:non-histone protein [Coemansia sp. IMI 203386]
MPKPKGSVALAETTDEKHHKYRCRDLKRQLEELEEYNEILAIKLLKSQKRLRRMRIERNILLERFEQTRRYDHNHDDYSASDSDAPLKNTFPHHPASDVDASEPGYRSANPVATPTTASSRGRRRAANGTSQNQPRSAAGTPQPQSANSTATHDVPAQPQPQTSTRKPRAEKDPLAPRRPANAFVLYCQVERPNIRSKGTDLTYTEMTKAMGVKWKNLSQEEKKKYFDMYEREMFRYQQELETYKGGGGSGAAGGSGGAARESVSPSSATPAAVADAAGSSGSASGNKDHDKDVNDDIDDGANTDADDGDDADADAEPNGDDGASTPVRTSVAPSSARSEISAIAGSEAANSYSGLVKSASQNGDMDVDREGSSNGDDSRMVEDHLDGSGSGNSIQEPGSTAETIVVANDGSDKEQNTTATNGFHSTESAAANGVAKDEADTVTSSPAANGVAGDHEEDRMSVDGRDESAAVAMTVSSPHKPAASSVPTASPVRQLL